MDVPKTERRRARDGKRRWNGRGRPFLHRAVWKLPEGLDGRGFVVFHVEHGVELGDLEQVVNLFREFQELQFPALVLHRGVGADEFADTRAVDVIYVTEVEKNLLLSLAKQLFYDVAENDAAFDESDSAAAIDNIDAVHLACAGFECHWEASLPSTAGPWTCLISLISVPVVEGLICTSSMNERIKKMPRPEVFSRFSGANGSGIFAGSSPLPSSRMVIIRSSPER